MRTFTDRNSVSRLALVAGSLSTLALMAQASGPAENLAPPKRRQRGRKDGGNDAVVELTGQVKALQTALNARDVEVKGLVEKALAESKASGAVSTETKAKLDAVLTTSAELSARLTELEQKSATQTAPVRKKSWGEQFTDHDTVKALAAGQGKSARVSMEPGTKAVGTITSATTGDNGVGVAIQPDRRPGIQGPYLRELRVRDLLIPGRTASNMIEYVKESSFVNNAAPVAEAAAKPQSSLTFEEATAPVRTIAHWVRATKQVLADIPLLQSYIDTRLRYGLAFQEEQQLLLGDGTGQNLNGLINQATDYNTGLTQAGDTPIDILRRAILQASIAEYRPSGVVLNPTDWANMELQKDDNGSYIWVNPQVGGTAQMWRLPVVESNSMPVGGFLVGAFNTAAQIFDREDASVELSTSDGTNFTSNLVTILAEERLALCVYRDEALIYGTFT